MKIICIGHNYAKHIKELGSANPIEPTVFLKPDSAILTKNKPFFIPAIVQGAHYETEVLVRINKVGKYIDAKFAHKYYDEIGLGIDFTDRVSQQKLKDKGLPWEKAKCFDGSAVIGQFFPKSNFENIDNINFKLYLNDELKQDGNTSDMLWNIDAIIAYVSQYFTLKKGDIIFTGTPAGVGEVFPEDVLIGILENVESFCIKVK